MNSPGETRRHHHKNVATLRQVHCMTKEEPDSIGPCPVSLRLTLSGPDNYRGGAGIPEVIAGQCLVNSTIFKDRLACLKYNHFIEVPFSLPGCCRRDLCLMLSMVILITAWAGGLLYPLIAYHTFINALILVTFISSSILRLRKPFSVTVFCITCFQIT